MPITLDDKAVDVFKLYNELAVAYSQDIEGYKTLLKAIEAMIAQKEEMLRGIKDKTVDLVKTSLEINESPKPRVRKKSKKSKNAGVDKKDLAPGKAIESEGAVEVQSQAITPQIQALKLKSTRNKKTAEKGKVKRAAKSKKPSKQSKKVSKTKSTNEISELKCLYHPESPVLDKGRQLCSSCKWKLINSGLKNYDKDPAVISYLKGETKEIPVLGQSMCPIHPSVPSYNQKTGLCKACQKKAKAIGVEDRHLTEEELTVVRNPSMKI
jgi:hypothetical protein